MTNYAEKYDHVPVTDPLVQQVWQEFVTVDFGLRVESIRRRGWHVLFIEESWISFQENYFLEALYARGIEELVICINGASNPRFPYSAGRIRLSEEADQVLDDTASVRQYIITDPHQQFCCLQDFNDRYLLAADLAFIEDVYRCSFKTVHEQTLDLAIRWKETEANPGWMLKTCHRYRELLPPGVDCVPPYITTESLLGELKPVQLTMPSRVEELVEKRDGEHVFSPEGLKGLGWSCMPLAKPYEAAIFDWACEGERLARAAQSLGYTRLEAFALDETGVAAAYQAEATRDGVLSLMALVFKNTILLTGSNAEFALLASPRGFVLLSAPGPLMLRMGGYIGEVPSWRYNMALYEAEESEPPYDDFMSEILLEYMELD